MNLNTRLTKLCVKLGLHPASRWATHIIVNGECTDWQNVYNNMETRDRARQQESDKQYVASLIRDYLGPNKASGFLDIGGGNGDVLHALHALPEYAQYDKDRFINVEQEQALWHEPYEFSHQDTVSYVCGFPESVLEPVSVVLCMVSLHHMSSNDQRAALRYAFDSLTSGGTLMVKEHDCRTEEDRLAIDWEHYLYHLRELKDRGQPLDWPAFKATFVSNYMSSDTLIDLAISCGFSEPQRRNRFLRTEPDTNPTNLYWMIFKK